MSILDRIGMGRRNKVNKNGAFTITNHGSAVTVERTTELKSCQ